VKFENLILILVVGVFAAIGAFAARLAYVLIENIAFQTLFEVLPLHAMLAKGACLVTRVKLASIEFIVFVFVPVVAYGAHIEALIVAAIVGIAYVTVCRMTFAHLAECKVFAACAALEIALFDDTIVADKLIRDGVLAVLADKDSHPSHHGILTTLNAVGEQVSSHDRRFNNVLVRALKHSFGHSR